MSQTCYGQDILYEKISFMELWKIFSIWVCTCHCTVVFPYLKVETGPGTRVIASRYPVPKTGNAASH